MDKVKNRKELIERLLEHMETGFPSYAAIAKEFHMDLHELAVMRADLMKEADVAAGIYKPDKERPQKTDGHQQGHGNGVKHTGSEVGTKSFSLRFTLVMSVCAASVFCGMFLVRRYVKQTETGRSKPAAVISQEPEKATDKPAASTAEQQPIEISLKADVVMMDIGTKYDPSSNVVAVRQNGEDLHDWSISGEYDENTAGIYPFKVEAESGGQKAEKPFEIHVCEPEIEEDVIEMNEEEQSLGSAG